MSKGRMLFIIALLVVLVLSFLMLGRLLTLGVIILVGASFTTKVFKRLWKILGTKE